ncbi:MAG: hypothetical protein ABIQ88_20580 [Chitinophagaceae bacterium]
MGYQPADIAFALIGHQDCWKKITGFVDFFSKSPQGLSAEKVAQVYSFIPPRVLFDVVVQSVIGQRVKGCYIETFISPDELAPRHWKKNIEKVKAAAACARKLGAGVASLGGFTSIVLEGRNDALNDGAFTKFTTGNSLTAAFIVKALEKACIKFDRQLADLQLLVIGATGDIGSACVEYFAGKVKNLLLCARQNATLQQHVLALQKKGLQAEASTDLATLLPQADLIIAIASSGIPNFNPLLCRKDVIICDAGYPRNLVLEFGNDFKDRLFYGGMGVIKGGYTFSPAVHHNLYKFPINNVAHGCMLEGIVLALEKLYTPFSAGRGNITPDKIEQIYLMAQKHGITEAPFFNGLNAWQPPRL